VFHAEVVKPHYNFQDIMESAWVQDLETVRKNPYEACRVTRGVDKYEKVKASWRAALEVGHQDAIDAAEVLLLLCLFSTLGAERQRVQQRSIRMYPFARGANQLSHQLLRYFPHLYPGLTR
jgi:hypothetical protein